MVVQDEYQIAKKEKNVYNKATKYLTTIHKKLTTQERCTYNVKTICSLTESSEFFDKVVKLIMQKDLSCVNDSNKFAL